MKTSDKAELQILTSNTPVFFDPSGKRWLLVKIFSIITALLIGVLISTLIYLSLESNRKSNLFNKLENQQIIKNNLTNQKTFTYLNPSNFGEYEAIKQETPFISNVLCDCLNITENEIKLYDNIEFKIIKEYLDRDDVNFKKSIVISASKIINYKKQNNTNYTNIIKGLVNLITQNNFKGIVLNYQNKNEIQEILEQLSENEAKSITGLYASVNLIQPIDLNQYYNLKDKNNYFSLSLEQKDYQNFDINTNYNIIKDTIIEINKVFNQYSISLPSKILEINESSKLQKNILWDDLQLIIKPNSEIQIINNLPIIEIDNKKYILYGQIFYYNLIKELEPLIDINKLYQLSVNDLENYQAKSFEFFDLNSTSKQLKFLETNFFLTSKIKKIGSGQILSPVTLTHLSMSLYCLL